MSAEQVSDVQVSDMQAADFLVEVGTEELPPKVLHGLMTAFAAGVREGLELARLEHGEIKAFATPRRLAVLVEALATGQEDRDIAKKGPPVSIALDDKGSPTKAGQAFAKKCGVDFDVLGREKTAAGEWLMHTAVEGGRNAAELLPDIVVGALDSLPVPRRMRWGNYEHEFVRPVQWLLMLHGEKVVPGAVLGIVSGRTTRGHRFMSGADLEIDLPGDYAGALQDRGFVVADFAARRQLIVTAVEAAAEKAGGQAIANDDLFDEVTALTEWPVALTGSFGEEFLSLPKEVVVATLTNHQRYFPVEDKRGLLLPVFVTIANLDSKRPEAVIRGNERVIRPRLADAAFFWESDQRTPLEGRADLLKKVVYQKGLGSLHDKSMRVAALASMLAEQTGADSSLVTRAAVLAKCDLLTGMVGEFPELQGTMGGYYANIDGEAHTVSMAINEQYQPRFAGDELPGSLAGQLLAVADKLDTLAGVFMLGKRPTGNRDPFGLRRAALGIVRILIETSLDINFTEAVVAAVAQQPVGTATLVETQDALLEFVMDRLRGYYLGVGRAYTADTFDAVRSRQPVSLVDFDERMKAVVDFRAQDSALSLAAANKRTANILRKANIDDAAEIEPLEVALLKDDAERVLYHAMQGAQSDLAPLIENRAYADALTRLATLRAPVDAFFDDVMIMCEDEALKKNRLALLAELRALFLNVADISRLALEKE